MFSSLSCRTTFTDVQFRVQIVYILIAVKQGTAKQCRIIVALAVLCVQTGEMACIQMPASRFHASSI